MQCCALKQRAVTVLSLYLQSASPYPRKTGMEARDLGRVRLHKLFSDGLDDYEYIYFDKEKGFCYEDNCVIGSTFDQTLDRLHSVGWCFKHNFFIKIQ